eukprot:gene54922-33586_t
MGLERALAALCAGACAAAPHAPSSPLVLLLNADPDTERAVDDALSTDHRVAPETGEGRYRLPKRLHADAPPAARRAAYLARGVVSVDARHLCRRRPPPLRRRAAYLARGVVSVDARHLCRRRPPPLRRRAAYLARGVVSVDARHLCLWPRYHQAARRLLDSGQVKDALLSSAAELCAELRDRLSTLLPTGVGEEELSPKGFALAPAWDKVPAAALRLRALLHRLHSDSCVGFLSAAEDATRRGAGGDHRPPDAS